ncbi:hypothetical protein Tco_0830569 [Tanacetum coccineum]
MSAFKVLQTQFQMFIKSRFYLDDEYVDMTRNKFLQYTRLDIPEFRDTLIQHMESVKKSIGERAQHKMEYERRVNERQIQTTEEKNTLMHWMRQQHTEQPEFNNEGKVDQNAEQCHDIRPLPAKLTDDKTIELSDQSLESENVCLKKIVAQFQKYFGKLEAHCINLELQLQMENNVLKSGQQSQFLKEKGNEAKVKHDIDVIETINIELEHKVAKLLKENETLKRHYKEMFDSIKTTRAKNIEHTTSLIATNDKFKAQIQEKGFAVAALKNELRKLTGNSVNTKFTKPSILGKPVGQPLKNQSVVRQPTAFKSERPRISKPRFASQVDVNNNLLKPVTTHYLPKRRESAPAKPHHMIATSSSRWVPTGKLLNSCTGKVENEPTHGSNVDIPHIHACKQTLGLSAGTSFNGQKQQRIDLNADALYNAKQENLRVWPRSSMFKRRLIAADQASVFMAMTFEQRSSSLVLHQMTSDHNRSELGIHDHSNEPSSSKLVPKVVPLAVKTATSRKSWNYYSTII